MQKCPQYQTHPKASQFCPCPKEVLPYSILHSTINFLTVKGEVLLLFFPFIPSTSLLACLRASNTIFWQLPVYSRCLCLQTPLLSVFSWLKRITSTIQVLGKSLQISSTCTVFCLQTHISLAHNSI